MARAGALEATWSDVAPLHAGCGDGPDGFGRPPRHQPDGRVAAPALCSQQQGHKRQQALAGCSCSTRALTGAAEQTTVLAMLLVITKVGDNVREPNELLNEHTNLLTV